MFAKPLVLVSVLSAVAAKRHLGRMAPDEAAHPAHQGSLVKPLKFNQQLLVCNAYPAKAAVKISKNDQPVLGALGFQQCSYSPMSVLAKDKLDFVLAETGIEGTFEVGDLPQTDSVLLLVLQKRDEKSPLMAFQSFAFPSNSGRNDAHVAVIDATSAGAKAHLQIADRPLQPGTKPLKEELSFNRIYALEQGKYDVSVLNQGKETPRQDFELNGGRDYVLLRTAGDTLGLPSLVAYPHDQVQSGATKSAVLVAFLAMISALFLA